MTLEAIAVVSHLDHRHVQSPDLVMTADTARRNVTRPHGTVGIVLAAGLLTRQDTALVATLAYPVLVAVVELGGTGLPRGATLLGAVALARLFVERMLASRRSDRPLGERPSRA